MELALAPTVSDPNAEALRQSEFRDGGSPCAFDERQSPTRGSVACYLQDDCSLTDFMSCSADISPMNPDISADISPMNVSLFSSSRLTVVWLLTFVSGLTERTSAA